MKPMRFKSLIFGTAGIPLSTKKRDTVTGIAHVRNLGLDAMELEFVHSVNIKKEKAPEVNEAAREAGIVLTCHAPYYLNLNSQEKKKLYASFGYILSSARILDLCGGWSACFHAAYYMKQPPGKVYDTVKSHVRDIVKKLRDESVDIWLRPEITGRPSQFGTLDELLKLSSELDGVMPCIDFSHLHARSNGNFNTYEEFSYVLEKVEKHLGKSGLRNMHIHISGINYGEKGEKNHLELRKSDMNYLDLLKALKAFKARGVVICESPNIEKDALLLKKSYKSV